MCPLRLLPKLFVFDNEELLPELRAQRSINLSRVPEIARYIVSNSDSYTFSAITASVDGSVSFEPVGLGSTNAFRMGTLSIDMDARFIVNDGQHRRAAIEQALASKPELGDETIAVVFFHDRGLERCQQMFADLNRHAVKPSPSLSILYDYRSAAGNVAKHLSLTANVFRNLIETERSSLSQRSRKLFTLSALNFAIMEMCSDKELEDFHAASAKCAGFWEAVGERIPEWVHVRNGKMTAGEVRQDFIHSHAIVLQALGRVGRCIYRSEKPDLTRSLAALSTIDWSRKSSALWEGRAMVGGRMSKNSQNVTLTCNQIKTALGLPLSPEEQNVENAFLTYR
jgi:DNA sulfur modification protein DndB